jgi:hypothetical protein
MRFIIRGDANAEEHWTSATKEAEALSRNLAMRNEKPVTATQLNNQQ